MSFFQKLKQGLLKTKNAFFGKIDDIFKSFVRIEVDFFEELEELLISADVGVETTESILDTLRDEIKDARVFHIVNLADTISSEAKSVSHEDLIPNFCEGAKKLGAITLFTKEMPSFPVKSVRLLTPEQEEPRALAFSEKDGGLAVEIPENTFSAYAMIVLE